MLFDIIPKSIYSELFKLDIFTIARWMCLKDNSKFRLYSLKLYWHLTYFCNSCFRIVRYIIDEKREDNNFMQTEKTLKLTYFLI